MFLSIFSTIRGKICFIDFKYKYVSTAQVDELIYNLKYVIGFFFVWE